jgi:hypothetical protein
MSWEVRATRHELGSTSYGLESTSYELGSTSYELGSTSYELESTSYDLESTSYELESTSYELESTSYELRTTYYGSSPMAVQVGEAGEIVFQGETAARYAVPIVGRCAENSERIRSQGGPRRVVSAYA